MDTRGENGELKSEEDKVQHSLLILALAALKLRAFAVKLNFNSTQNDLGCLHSGVSRSFI